MTESTDKPLLDKALADEQQLDEYLKGDSSVSRQYRQLHSAEVPTQLDRVVLRQAEDAVKSRPAQRRPAWVRWTAPLAVAASAVLVLSIVVETGVRDETTVLRAPQPTTQAKRERVESKSEEATVSEQVAPGFMPPAEIAAEPATEELLADHAEPQQIAPAAPPPPKLNIPSPQALHSAEPASEAPNTVAEKVSEAPQAAAQDRSSPPPAAAPAVLPKVMPARSVSRSAEDAARALQPVLDEAAHKQSAGAASEAAREERSAAENAYSRRISAPMPTAPQSYSDPQAWLKAIRELRKANKQDEADREWRRFRAAFPEHEVAETDSAREAEK